MFSGYIPCKKTNAADVSGTVSVPIITASDDEDFNGICLEGLRRTIQISIRTSCLRAKI
jgi:hypothetical protein